MKLNILAIFVVAVLMCGCSRSSSDQSTAEPKQEDESKADWQLLDDSIFIATVEPWPPKEGSAMLKAEATMDDGDQKFAGTVAYRLAAGEQSEETWKPMPKVSEDEDGSIHFAAPIVLTKGTIYIHFRVRDRGDEDFTDLTDWKVTIK